MQTILQQTVFQRVAHAIERIVDVGSVELTHSTRLLEDLAFGRFRRLKLAIRLEDSFDVEIHNDTAERFRTLGDIVSYLNWHADETGSGINEAEPAGRDFRRHAALG